MRDAQGNCCAICQEPFEGTPHIDHCHFTGRARGLLLGMAKDRPEVLLRAAEYLGWTAPLPPAYACQIPKSKKCRTTTTGQATLFDWVPNLPQRVSTTA
jgi:hypothetical protein